MARLLSRAEPFVQFLTMAYIELVVYEEMYFKDISYLELWQPLCSMELANLCNFGRVHHEEQFCEIILNLELWFRRRGSKTF